MGRLGGRGWKLFCGLRTGGSLSGEVGGGGGWKLYCGLRTGGSLSGEVWGGGWKLFCGLRTGCSSGEVGGRGWPAEDITCKHHMFEWGGRWRMGKGGGSKRHYL